MKLVLFAQKWEHLVELLLSLLLELIDFLELNLANGELLLRLVKLLLRLDQFASFSDNLNGLFVIVLLMNEY